MVAAGSGREAFEAFGLFCPAGAQVRGWFPVGELNSGTRVALPVRLAHGAREGPVVGMDGMLHGDEYNSYAVINRLFDEIDPADLHGTLIGIPVANPFAMHANNRISPLEYERLNLNRVFPGSPGGFQMERVAHAIFSEGVLRSDVWLDFHEGGRDFLARYLIVGTEEDSSAAPRDLELARWFGQGIPITAVPLTEALVRLGRAGTITFQAQRAGKRSLGIELGGGGTLHEHFVRTGVTGAMNILRGLGMLPGGPPNVESEPPQYVSYETIWPRPAHGGFWEQDVELGDVVEEGQVIGRVRNLFGETVEELRAPFRSVITDVRHTATIQTGEWNVKCARIEIEADSRLA
jgi:uncharacterized protein